MKQAWVLSGLSRAGGKIHAQRQGEDFLAVHDIFKLARRSLLGKGWENLLQSEEALRAP